MKRKFMERILEGTKKIAAPAETETGSAAETETGSAPGAAQDAPHRAEGEDTKKTRGERTGRETAQIGDMDIFDDTDVCRVLGLRRRELVRRRTADRRGIDWDVCGTHVGMTERWIKAWNAKADMKGLKPIRAGDGIVTVKIAGRVTNVDVVIGNRIADGTRVMVRGIGRAWYLHLGDEMDCRMVGGMLTFDQELNRERY